MAKSKTKKTSKGSAEPKAKQDALEQVKLSAMDVSSEDEDDDDHSSVDSDAENVEQTAGDQKKDSVRKTKKQTSRKNHRTKKQKRQDSTVLYIGHLPNLFGEAELMQFLTQFGAVQRLQVSRNPKTLNSRGYAFVQMKDAETAAIVADTLSGYLLFDRKQHVRKRIVCHVVPPDKVHPRLFVKPKKTRKATAAIAATMIRKPAMAAMKSITERLVAREQQKRQKLKEAGIDYDFPGYEAGAQKIEAAKEENENDGEDEEAAPSKQISSKRKGSVDSAASETSKSKKRKESIDADESADKTMLSEKKKKNARKDSVDSAEQATTTTTTTTKKVHNEPVSSVRGSTSEEKKKKKSKKKQQPKEEEEEEDPTLEEGNEEAVERKESQDSVAPEEVAANAEKKSSSKKHKKHQREDGDANEVAESNNDDSTPGTSEPIVKVTQSEKKKKKKRKKDKNRRQSA